MEQKSQSFYLNRIQHLQPRHRADGVIPELNPSTDRAFVTVLAEYYLHLQEAVGCETVCVKCLLFFRSPDRLPGFEFQHGPTQVVSFSP